MLKPINIVLICDKNYIAQTSITISSVLINNKNNKLIFYIFAYDFFEKPNLFKKLEKQYNAKINLIPTKKYNYLFNNQNQATFKNDYITKATYLRLLAFKVLPLSVDRFIYLDSDILVLGDLGNLFYKFDQKKYFGAVAEINVFKYGVKWHKHLYKIDDFKFWANDYKKYPYFNAGFFICNLNLCRKIKVFELCLDFLKRYPNPVFADQDLLNAIFSQKFHNHIAYCDFKYNLLCDLNFKDYTDGKDYFYSSNSIINAITNPIIVHYDGKNKPWVNRFNKNYWSLWWQYCERLNLNFTKPKNKFGFFMFAKKIIRKCKLFNTISNLVFAKTKNKT